MGRYTVTARFTPDSPPGAQAVEAVFDTLADALLGQPDLIDPDVGANLQDGWLDVTTMVDADDDIQALHIVADNLRRAIDDINAGSARTRLRVDIRPAESVCV